MPRPKPRKSPTPAMSSLRSGCSVSGQVSVEWTILLMVIMAAAFALGIALNASKGGFVSTTGSGWAAGMKELGSEVVRRAATP
ncbi:hypothetical protein [Methanopyrus sp.]